jgi:hypothetical protein
MTNQHQWKVQYIVQGTVRETLRSGVQLPLAKYIQKQAQNSGNYELGLVSVSVVK